MADALAGKARLRPGRRACFSAAPVAMMTARADNSPSPVDEPPAVAVARARLCSVVAANSAPAAHRLLLRDRAEIVARDAIGKPGIAFDLLDAQKLPAEHVAGQHQRLAAKLGCDHAGRQTGNAAARDDDVECIAHDPKYRSRMLR